MKVFALVRAILSLILLTAIVVVLVLLPAQGYLGRFLESLEGLGLTGMLCLVVAYVPVCLLFLPGVLLTLGAGFLFGPIWGAVVATSGGTLGATAAFLVSRLLARQWIERRIGAHPKFVAIDRAVAREGFKAVLLIRLCPFFPINVVNYALGLTQIPLGPYVLATWLGRIPGLSTCVYVGSAAKSLADVAAGRVQMGTGEPLLFALGLVVMVVTVVFLARIAQRALRETIGDQAEQSPSLPGEPR